MFGKLLLFFIIRLLISIASFHFLHEIYINTVIDPFHYSFGYEEKKKLFKGKDTNQLNVNSRCKAYEESIMNTRTEKLGDIFELKYGQLFSCSYFLIAFLMYDIFRLSLGIISIILFNIYNRFHICIFLLSIIIKIQKDVLRILDFVYFINIFFFIYAIYSFYSGDTNDYYNFLFCKNINYDEFDKYSVVVDVKFDFRYYMILQIISTIGLCTTSTLINRNN